MGFMATSNISINPLTFGQRKLFSDQNGQANTKEFQKFLSDLAQWANQIQTILTTPNILATALNGSNPLFATSLSTVQASFVNVAVNQSQACDGAALILVTMSINSAVTLTLTLTHVPFGAFVIVRFVNNFTSPETFKLAWTNPSGTSLSAFGFTGTTVANLTTTGVSVPNSGQVFFVGTADSINSQLVLSQT